MRFSAILAATLPILVSAKVLISYNAAAGDPVSNLDFINFQGYDRADWPKGKENSSLIFKTATDPDGVPAAYVHKAPHFVRAEYHMLKTHDQPVKDTTYYIGYKVRFDNTDDGLIVFQWKNYLSQVDTDNVPISLFFRPGNLIGFRVQTNPNVKGSQVVWTKQLTPQKTYQFGIVINTSLTQGFVQMYFNGQLINMVDASSSTGSTTQKLAGNFFPGGEQGAASPKVGLYGNKNPVVDNSYIYNVVVGTSLSDIKSVAGIS